MRNGKLMTKRVAAIALSSMMVLSPLTAFAADPNVPGSNGQDPVQAGTTDPTAWATNGEIFGVYDQNGNLVEGNIQSGKILYGPENDQKEKESFFLEFDKNTGGTEADASGNITKAFFKKTISLKNIKNDDFIPSVPDIEYVYTIEPTDYVGTGVDEIPASYNGAVINKGIPGGIITENTTTKVVFSHDDNPNGDVSATADYRGSKDNDKFTMSKLVEFNLDPSVFQATAENKQKYGLPMDAGVYRYILIENEEKNIDGVTENTPQDILDDVTKIGDIYRGRILDVVIEKVNPQPTDPARRIVGVAMHEVTLRWKYDQSGKRQTWEIVAVNGKTKVEGYTPYSFKKEGEDGNGPKEAHSRYYTYDFVIGKELTGRGLTEADNSVEFKFDVTIEAPNGADLAGVTQLGTNAPLDAKLELDAWKDSTRADRLGWTMTENNADAIKMTKQITLKGTEHFEISGLPGGAKVTVAETTETAKGYNQKHNETVITGLKEDGKLISVSKDAADKEAFTATVVAGADKDGASYTYTIENYKKVNAITIENEAQVFGEEADDTAASKAIQNGFILNVKNPITVTGVVMNVAPYALMVIAAAIFAGLFISKKRQEEEL